MRFGWEVTGAGWTEVAVGDATLVVSYVGLGPEAVSQSLLGYAAEVTFEGEPEQYGVTFQRTGDDLTIHVLESATEPVGPGDDSGHDGYVDGLSRCTVDEAAVTERVSQAQRALGLDPVVRAVPRRGS
jgi:hypothetical protein